MTIETMTEGKILTVQDRFSVSEKVSETIFSPDHIDDLNQSAHDVVSAVMSLEKLAIEKSKSLSERRPVEINQIEQKIDLLTELMTGVLLAQTVLPEKKCMKMSAEQLSWSPFIEIEKDQYCLVSIFFTRKYPLPLRLPVLVTQKGDEGLITGKILLSDEGVIDDFSRLIFLFHRRQIARKKTYSKS